MGVLNMPLVPQQVTERQLMKTENFLCIAETIAAGSQQPACSRSQPGTLCLPPCATLIWKDELSPEKSHTAVYGAEEHSAE